MTAVFVTRRSLRRRPPVGGAAGGVACGSGSRRQGLTLIEMLLVLALVVAMAAMVVPTLGVFDDEYLRQAAEQVRGDWTAARVEAMTSGLTQVFRYEIETGEYVLQPWEGDDALLEASAGASASGGISRGTLNTPESGNGSLANPAALGAGGFGGTSGSPYAAPAGSGAGMMANTSAVHQKTLPEQIKIASCQVGMDIRAVQVADAVGSSYLAPPILFYPDGTTSDAILTLVNEEGDSISLQLRGLTGITQVSEISYQQGLVPTGPNPAGGGMPAGGLR